MKGFIFLCPYQVFRRDILRKNGMRLDKKNGFYSESRFGGIYYSVEETVKGYLNQCRLFKKKPEIEIRVTHWKLPEFPEYEPGIILCAYVEYDLDSLFKKNPRTEIEEDFSSDLFDLEKKLYEKIHAEYSRGFGAKKEVSSFNVIIGEKLRNDIIEEQQGDKKHD
jgi:hypothetical protein